MDGCHDQCWWGELGSDTAPGWPDRTMGVRLGWDVSPQVALLPLIHLWNASIPRGSLWNFCQTSLCYLLCSEVSHCLSSQLSFRSGYKHDDILCYLAWCICLTNVVAKCRCRRLLSQAALELPLSYFIFHVEFWFGNSSELVVFSYLHQNLVFCKTSLMPFEKWQI